MPPDPTIDPYKPPTQPNVPAELSDEPAPLLDPRLLGWFAVISIFLQVAVILASYFQPGHLRYDEGFEVMAGLLLLSSAVAYLFWIRRCAANALLLSRDGENYSPGWAVGSYLLPLANLVVPCLVMREITRKTFKHLPHSGMDAIVFAWWFSFIGRGISSMVAEEIQSPIAVWIHPALNVLAMLLISYLIARISLTQANFRWSDVPETERPDRTPHPGPKPIIPRAPHASSSVGPFRPNFPSPSRPTTPRPTPSPPNVD